ncbi:hypothetical protein CWE15_11060 [Aliidiomarina taiwanensis]|uniref:Uncharacterized protein n=2 Tax=Aliidiomarina taiwanensis TaxID=946228 RepID=A0A432WVU8_9GAMM|nr:hypothetical protein CWE15_11060 [Aliidiomarina taiwanensis]
MIWLSVNFDVFMQNLLRFSLRENSTFDPVYFSGGLHFPEQNQDTDEVRCCFNRKVKLATIFNRGLSGL